MIAAGMTGMLVLGASTVMNSTVGSQKKTDVQSLIDREFAAGSQLAANAEVLRGILRPDLFTDTCLTKDHNSGCTSHSAPGWVAYPANARNFNSTFNLLGPCVETDPRCMVRRRMYYRWICSNQECSGVETKVTVEPLQKEAGHYRARESIVKLDRRQLMSRADLAFSCNGGNQSLTSIDYDQAQDGCSVQPQTTCPNMPGRAYDPFDTQAHNCSPGLTSTCTYGYDYTGFFENGAGCKAQEPNGPASYNEYTGTPNYTPNGSGPALTANNASTVMTTVTSVYTSTTTVTVVDLTAGCSTGTHPLYEYSHPTYGFYYPPNNNDTNAFSLGYSLTGATLTAFDEPCGDRLPLIDCMAPDRAHYLANGSCGSLGSPVYANGANYGYIHQTRTAVANSFVTRYYRSNGYVIMRQSKYGAGAAGFTEEGGQGWLPPGNTAAATGRWVETYSAAGNMGGCSYYANNPTFAPGGVCTSLGSVCNTMTGNAISGGIVFHYWRCQ